MQALLGGKEGEGGEGGAVELRTQGLERIRCERVDVGAWSAKVAKVHAKCSESKFS